MTIFGLTTLNQKRNFSHLRVLIGGENINARIYLIVNNTFKYSFYSGDGSLFRSSYIIL